MTASNNPECFRAFVGKTVKGVLFDALPLNNPEISSGSNTLVFDDGRGLTITHNGAFWVDSKNDVQRAVDQRLKKLRDVKFELEETLEIAGFLDKET